MKKSILKGALLFTSMIALAAPAGASATVWGPVNTTGSLDSTDFRTTMPAFGVSCQNVHLGVHTRSPASSTLDVTAATFTNCVGNGAGGAGCSVAETATGLPWTATALSSTTTNLAVANVNITFTGTCPYAGGATSYSGTLTPGSWTNATHKLSFSSAGGLSVAFFGPMQVSASFKDPLSVLTQS